MLNLDWILPSDNERFEKHRYISLSPSSTTIYTRSYDLIKNKYHVPFKHNKETGEQEYNPETGELLTIQPPQGDEKKHNGFISQKASRQLRRSVQYFMSLQHPAMLIDGEGKDNLTFLTLTLPSSQIEIITDNQVIYKHTDKEIKSKCFNGFMTELRQNQGVKSYVWRSERQMNGSLHFHILLDRKIDYLWLRDRWNSYTNLLGYVDSYSEKMNKLTLQEYINIRSNGKTTTKQQIDKFTNTYYEQKQLGWTSPNSTDIHCLSNIDNVAAYIGTYMSEHSKHTQRQTANYLKKQFNLQPSDELVNNWFKADGRIWQCSQNISKARRCITEGCQILVDELNNLKNTCQNVKEIVEDGFKTILHSFKDIYTSTQYIYEYFENHLRAHIQSNNVDILCADFDNNYNIVSPALPSPPLETHIFESPKQTIKQTTLNLWQNQYSLV